MGAPCQGWRGGCWQLQYLFCPEPCSSCPHIQAPLLRKGFPRGTSSKESACNAEDPGDMGLIPGLGRSLGEGTGNPLQHSCLKNPMDRGAWRTTVHSVAKSPTRLSKQARPTPLGRVLPLFCLRFGPSPAPFRLVPPPPVTSHRRVLRA